MFELRFDMATSDCVVFAPSRALRPKDERKSPATEPTSALSSCPFCPGNEAFTPPEINAVRLPERSGPSTWKVRVFPNRACRHLARRRRQQAAGKM